MNIVRRLFGFLIVQTFVSVTYGFLSHQRKSTLSSLTPSRNTDRSSAGDFTINRHPAFETPTHNVLKRHRRSVANVQTMGLFGLGGPEIAIILAVGAFVIGPQQLGNMLGSMTGSLREEYRDLPDDLKKIPEEFQKGYEESTENARARNAKPMETPSEEEKKD